MYEGNENIGMLLPVVLPIAAGAAVLLAKGLRRNRKTLLTLVLGTLFLEAALVV